MDDNNPLAMVLAFLAIMIIAISSCGGTEMAILDEVKPLKSIEIIEVEGMTCVIYKQSNSGGISCNWSEWGEDKRE